MEFYKLFSGESMSKNLNLMIYTVIFVTMFFKSTFSYGNSFKLIPLGIEHLENAERSKVIDFLDEVKALLPLKFKDYLNIEMAVKFSTKLSRKTGLPKPECNLGAIFPNKKGSKKVKQENALGRYVRNKGILLNFNFIDHILKGDRLAVDYDCEHKNFYQLLKATLIHELSHAFDNKKLNIAASKKSLKLKKCLKFKKRYFIYPNSACEQRAREQRNNLSDLIQYRHLSGYADKGLIFPSSTLSHHVVKRSPHPYEYKKRTEHFPVNMEFFLLDPEYKCRRPALYKFFSLYFEHTPFPEYSCSVNTNLKLNNIIDQSLTQVDLRVRRIHSIHYLYATAGTGMFRVVLCERNNSSSDECVRFSDDDIVFSYKRTGRKFIKVDVQSMMEIKYQYNDMEFRDLYSLPIKMDAIELELFFYQLLSDYWEFTGKYYFGGGTVTTELVRPIKGAIRSYDFYSMHPLSPKSLYKDLVKTKIVNRDIFKTISKPVKNGYLFLSSERRLKLMFKKIKSVSKRSKIFKNFNYYVLISKNTDRKRSFDSIRFKTLAYRYEYLKYFNQLQEYIFMKRSYKLNFSKKEAYRKTRHNNITNKRDYGIPMRQNP